MISNPCLVTLLSREVTAEDSAFLLRVPSANVILLVNVVIEVPWLVTRPSMLVTLESSADTAELLALVSVLVSSAVRSLVNLVMAVPCDVTNPPWLVTLVSNAVKALASALVDRLPLILSIEVFKPEI